MPMTDLFGTGVGPIDGLAVCGLSKRGGLERCLWGYDLDLVVIRVWIRQRRDTDGREEGREEGRDRGEIHFKGGGVDRCLRILLLL